MYKAIVTLLILLALVPAAVLPARADSEEARRYQRRVENYVVPDVIVVNQDGERLPFRQLLDPGKPVMLDFIYGTCTTICPILSAGFSSLQRRLGPAAGDVQLVSVSIDPEHDTPEVMTDYLSRYSRKPGWDFVTGSRDDIDRVMHAFSAYVPNKMSHQPLTFLRGAGDSDWVRIYGLVGTSDLMAEYQQLKKR
jgi:protein SCO1/2